MTRPVTPLLLYLSHARDPQRFAVGPALAAAAEGAGWAFECYYDDLRRGRHWGSGEPRQGLPGWAAGSLVSGGRHHEQLLWLATRHQVVALGDAGAVLWPALDALGAETLAVTGDPTQLLGAAFERLGVPLPTEVLVVDGRPQGRNELVVSPYLYPAILSGPPVLAVDASSSAATRRGLEDLGATIFRGCYVETERAANFPGGLDELAGDASTCTYAQLTAELAHAHRPWGRGVLLGDPELVGAQLPKARRLRLLPLYGCPQVDVIARAEPIIAGAAEPVFGRQFDDRDFFALSELGHGFQIIDPDPPFDAAFALAPAVPARAASVAPSQLEPSDAQLRAWADEGRVLVTMLFWSGMLREIDLINRLVDLVATTDLHGGLVVTAETIQHATGAALGLLATPVERGGVGGHLNLLLASTGRGVAPEATLPPGALGQHLDEARTSVAARLPAALVPRGWWPLLDTTVVPARPPVIGRERALPRIRVPPRGIPSGDDTSDSTGQRPDLRHLAGRITRRTGLDRFVEERRPYDHVRPGPFDTRVAEAVLGAGFSYMWTKANFGNPTVAWRDGDFVAMPFTAGNWDGWTPFYTLGSGHDVVRAERRLLRDGRAGWLASTVDSPLFAMSGEILEHGSVLYRMAELVARGGRSGRLLNVTPDVVARYARLLDDRRQEAGAAGETTSAGRSGLAHEGTAQAPDGPAAEVAGMGGEPLGISRGQDVQLDRQHHEERDAGRSAGDGTGDGGEDSDGGHGDQPAGD
jgi:hypothetical protein